MKFSDDDFTVILEHFPDLYVNTERTKILGELSFTAIFDGNQLRLNPKAGLPYSYFKGYYEIEIRLFNLDRYELPKVYETSAKIFNFAQENHIRPMDLHLNEDWSCCLGIFTRGEAQNMTLYRYIMEYVFSFFAWQAYRVTFNTKPPWGEYSHNYGFQEKNMELFITMSKTGRNDPCPCGSGKKFKQCCMDKYEAYKRGM